MKNIIILISLLITVFCLDNGVGLVPPMGWNSWNHFGCNINQQLIKQTADILVSSGLAKKGYKYVNLDDCWQVSRNPTTHQIIPDSNFPSGMAALADYIHSKGLLFGLYSDSGYYTCAGRPGSLNYETIDAQTYANWGVDYLKYDNCNSDKTSPKLRYPIMRNALNKTGRKIFFSMCEWGSSDPTKWAQPVANSWRTTGDISDNWSSFTRILELQVGFSVYSGPGGWNDPDMLEVGNGGMTNDQYQAHFAFWAALKSPLLIGCDLTKLNQQTLKILGNQQLIAVNQDPLGIQADRFKKEVYLTGEKQYWGGKLSGNRYIILLLNKQIKQATFEFSLSIDLFMPKNLSYSMRDIIQHTDLGTFKFDTIRFENVKSHSVKAIILTFLGEQKEIQK